MTETVVHVTTLEQWESVLNVWFEQGYEWNGNNENTQSGRFRNYYYEAFRDGCRQLALRDTIYFYGKNGYKGKTVEYSEFISQQKEDKEMKTYYVTKEQLDLIESVKDLNFPLTGITAPENFQKEFDKMYFYNQKEVLRYLGGDETIDFKVKKQLYRLWRIDDEGNTVYMTFSYGTPEWTYTPGQAFTALLEEIKNWQTPAWSMEEVK